jgi:hypothetical protein
VNENHIVIKNKKINKVIIYIREKEMNRIQITIMCYRCVEKPYYAVSNPCYQYAKQETLIGRLLTTQLCLSQY